VIGTNDNVLVFATGASADIGNYTSITPGCGSGSNMLDCQAQTDTDIKGPVQFPTNQTQTDCSGSITTGGTAQNAFAAQTSLHGFTIANTDPSSGSGEPLWISFTTTAAAATAGSYPLAAPATTTYAGMGSFSSPPGMGTGHGLSVEAATTGHKYSCTWW
jgi:hypothetical protein